MTPQKISLVTQVSAIFGEEGLLSTVSGFERRPEQFEMACAIAKALEEETHLVVEAGTGVGKSLAYLVPAVLYAIRSRHKAIICTHTITLQEQLLYKDLPLVQKILGLPFDAVLLQGRHNYFCPARFHRAQQYAHDLFAGDVLPELERIRLWSETTRDGTRSSLSPEPDPQVWAQVCSDRSLCSPKTCGKDARCFYQAARKRSLSADVLILNHTLFFTLLEDGSDTETGYLFPHDFVILDEAHTIETIAAKHFGITLSQYALKQLLHRLYYPRTRKGIFAHLKASKAITLTTDLLEEMDAFFDSLLMGCDFKQGREFRIRGREELAFLKSQKRQSILEGLSRLEILIEIIAAPLSETTKAELTDIAGQLAGARENLLSFIEQSEPEFVYWIEKSGPVAANITLHAAPVDMASHLSEHLFRKKTTAILTSATLSTGAPQLEYFRSRIGASEVEALELGSPFDYAKQMTLHLVRQMPDPRDRGYEEELKRWIIHFTEQSQARAFVLFTSYRSMHNVAALLKSFFEKKKWNLLIQGKGISRSHMLEEFRSGKPSVLFGTESFWTGVDVPGEALSNVIITRLPFATPDHPLIEARFERIVAEGGDGFREYSLPEAILKLRQGVGRLIRNKTDHGTIVILDSRIIHKPYGKAFLNALPKCPREVL